MDIYAAVTERIIEQMEQGIIPWQKPWISNSKAISHATGKPYRCLRICSGIRPQGWYGY